MNKTFFYLFGILVFLSIGINNTYAASPVPPSITTQSVDVTVTAPATATFKVVATGTPTPTYQWMQEAPGASTFSAVTGATKASYTTAVTTVAESGTQYECIVSNVAGSVTSDAATLTVNVKPSIITQPTSLTVTAPAPATFTVVATGIPTPAYQWQQEIPGTTTYVAITGAISASYTTEVTTLANSGTKYECVISNVAGSVTSAVAKLTVQVTPSITTQPVNVIITAPTKATFTLVATGTPTPTYQWMESVSGGSFSNITGATKASYTTAVTTVAESGTQYECIVSNVAGSVTSNAVTLTVNSQSAPSIITQPVNATVTAPAPATFTVVATGSPTPSYQWMQSVNGGAFTNISGATIASYTTPATAATDSGTQFECVVTNVVGSVTSSPATLTVNVISSITVQPTNLIVTAPATATFSVTASGNPAPTYQWMQETLGANTFTSITGATSSSYTTPATTTVNNGSQYECVVTNSVGSITSNAATLTVNPSSPPAVTITSPANNSILAAGSNLTISANASETNGTISSVSFYNGTTLLGSSTTSPYSYTVTNVSAGTYSLIATATDINNVSTTSSPVTVTVNNQPVVAITSPANNSSSNANSNITITASASETSGTISFVSFYNGSTLLGTSTSSPYSFVWKNVPVGIYNLTATATGSNSIATTSSPVTITVNGIIVNSIINPVNQGAFTTGSINITVIASENYGGISNVAFYNGSTLLGTVSSTDQAFTYSWTNIPAGTYSITAVATDVAGAMMTSSPVTITINPAIFTLAVDDNITSKTDPRGNTTSYRYDNLNRLTLTTFADNSTVANAYDLFGNQISVTDQRGNVLTKTYDAYERLSQAKDPLGAATSFSYDTEGHLLTLTDANNNSTSYTYNPNGKVLTQSNALNFVTTYTYDPDSNIASKQDANGKITTYAYDALNRLTNTTYPDSTTVANVYDALGRKTSMTDATGQTTYSYDALNRLITKKSQADYGQAITYSYDGESNQLSINDQNNRTITNTYDALNRLATVTAPNGTNKYGSVGTTTYGYDANSNKISVLNNNGSTTSYTYDTLNRVLTTVNSAASGIISSFANTYDIAGMITKKVFQGGSWTSYSYDALNQLLEEANQTSAGINYDYVYSYDPVGNRLTWTKNTTLGSFWSVDSAKMPSQVLTNMTAAGYGNTANPTQAVVLTRTYTNDAGNRLTGWNYAVNIYSTSFPVQSDTYTYDNNGNRITKQAILTGQAATPQQTSYSYDFENRLNALGYTNIPNITGTQTDSFDYDGEGLRKQVSINSVLTNYVYDGLDIMMEVNSGNVTKAYTRAVGSPGGIEGIITQNYISGSNTVTQYYQYNDLGSVSNTTTSTDTTASSYNYDAFGNLLTPQSTSDPNRYLFSTKEFDSRSGLEYFGGRYYDPEVGRWLTQDPFGFVNGPDEYAYCGNNPINCVDPLGLYWGEDQVDWWIYQSVVPGPYGQPVSEWGSNGPTGWGDLIGEADNFGGEAGCLERAVVGVAAGATAIASGAIILDSDPLIGWKGGEITFTNPGASSPDFRINPFGDWDSDNPYARLPHYHSRPGIGNHRPWEGVF